MKPGYKQTEVGVIPKDWEVKSLAALAERIMVGIASAATHAYRTKGVPMFRNQNIKSGFLDDGDLLFVDPEYEKTFRNKRLRGGDLLTARTGYPGTTCVVPARYESAQSFTTLITRPNTADIDSSFLCHYINSEEGQKFFEQSQIGGAQKNVNAGTLRKMPVPIPPPPEQRAIATALSDVDGLLGGLDRLIAKKRDLKLAAMQQLLTGQTRLPGFNGKWEVRRLEDLCTMKSGEGITAKNIDDVSAFPCYGGNGLRGFSTRFTHEGNYCLIGRVGALCGNLLQVTGRFFASEHAIVVTAYENVDVCWLTLALGTLRLNRRAESSAQPVLTVSKLRPLELIAPVTKEEQTEIAEVLTDMDVELAALEQRRNKTRALKQGMMQELLTGRIRLV